MGKSKDLISKLVGMLSLRVKDERNTWFASFKYFPKCCAVIILVPCALVVAIRCVDLILEEIVNIVRALTPAQKAIISNHYEAPKDWFTNRCEEKNFAISTSRHFNPALQQATLIGVSGSRWVM